MTEGITVNKGSRMHNLDNDFRTGLMNGIHHFAPRALRLIIDHSGLKNISGTVPVIRIQTFGDN